MGRRHSPPTRAKYASGIRGVFDDKWLHELDESPSPVSEQASDLVVKLKLFRLIGITGFLDTVTSCPRAKVGAEICDIVWWGIL
jgi:hypothetical protein